MAGVFRAVFRRFARHRSTCSMAPSGASSTEDALRSSKRAMRRQVNESLRSTPPASLLAAGERAALRLMETPTFREARVIALYVSSQRLREVPTRDVIARALEERKHVYLPHIGDGKGGPNSMRMLRVTDVAEVAPPAGSMELEEPPLTCADGSRRPDLEDADALPLDLVVCPGVAFDAAGGRLGRGGGFYDAFLGRMRARTTELDRAAPRTIGLCVDAQVVDRVPRDDHDFVVNELVTESRAILTF